MNAHEKADDLADTMSRRGWRTGSLYQRASDGRWLGTIEAGFTASGSRRRVTVTAKTKSEAMRRLRDKRLELDREGRRQVKRTTSVARYAETWLGDIRPHVRPSAYDTDRAAVRAITAALGSVRLADLTTDDVRSLARWLRGRGKSTSTALRYHGSLMRMLKAASRDGYAIPPNVLLAEQPKKAVHDRQALTMTDVEKVVPVIAERADGSRWSLALLQGLRQAEALGLTWDAVDLDAGTLTVSWQAKSLRYVDRKHPERGFEVPDGYEVRHLIGAAHLVRPKSAAGQRVIPLVPWAVTALREWRAVAPANRHGLVWPGRTVSGDAWPRNPAGDREEWWTIQEAAGIAHPAGRPYLVHELRNTTATVLMELKVPESVRIAIMGHSNIAVTRGYEYVELDQARAALEQAARRLALD